MAANTTTKRDSSPSLLWGRPEPEKMGSFCPRTRELRPSMAEMPVWMNSRG